MFIGVFVTPAGKNKNKGFFLKKSTGIAYFPVIMQNMKMVSAIPGDYNYREFRKTPIVLYLRIDYKKYGKSS